MYYFVADACNQSFSQYLRATSLSAVLVALLLRVRYFDAD